LGDSPPDVVFIRRQSSKNGGKWRFFEGQKRQISVLGAGFFSEAIDVAAFTLADFFGAPEKSGCRAPFSGEDFVDVTPSRYES
jgi:hypothetical protein